MSAILRKRYESDASEPWAVAQARLAELSYLPSEEAVAHALQPIALPRTLEGHEASRVLALMDVKTAKSAILALAQTTPRGYYDSVKLVTAVLANRSQRRTQGQSASARKQALGALPESDQRSLAFARHVEHEAVEVARAHEKLAKMGAMPKWAAVSKRKAANDETRRRKELEDRLLKGIK